MLNTSPAPSSQRNVVKRKFLREYCKVQEIPQKPFNDRMKNMILISFYEHTINRAIFYNFLRCVKKGAKKRSETEIDVCNNVLKCVAFKMGGIDKKDPNGL